MTKEDYRTSTVSGDALYLFASTKDARFVILKGGERGHLEISVPRKDVTFKLDQQQLKDIAHFFGQLINDEVCLHGEECRLCREDGVVY
tara:strand:+ start:7425 stop:7691 length:267 start_codon:yes stop_codon:yes gene_type:complete